MKQLETLNEYRVFYHVFDRLFEPSFTLFMFCGDNLIGSAEYIGRPDAWNLRKAVDRFVNTYDFFTVDTLYKCLLDITADDDTITGTIPGFSKRERFDKIAGTRFYHHAHAWH